MKYMSFVIASLCLFSFNVLAIPQVTFTGPTPAFPSTMNVGDDVTYTFVVKNYANHAWGFSLSGVSTPVTRAAAANDCGSSIPANGSCQFAIQIAPTATGTIAQTFQINYGSRTPYQASMNITVNATTELSAVSVGYYTPNTGVRSPVTYYLNSQSTWEDSIPSSPAATGLSNLTGVSCGLGTDLQNCVTVGYYPNPTVIYPLVYTSTNAGQAWSNYSPTSYPTNLTGSSLNGVSCIGSTALTCASVGFYQTTTLTNPQPIIYFSSNSGVSWTYATPTAATSTNSNYLESVSCTTANNAAGLQCIAVGYYVITGGVSRPMSYSSTDGSTWNLNTTFTLPNVSNLQGVSLKSVSCSDSSHCVAVGSYSYTGAPTQPLIYYSTNGGATWTLVTTLATASNTTSLSGVSCVEVAGESQAFNCVAVGLPISVSPTLYITNNSDGSTWTTKTLSKYNGYATSLESIACQSMNTCYLAGFYTNVYGIPIIYNTTDGFTSTTMTPLTAQGSGNSTLDSIALTATA